jgi:uncharacterized membrane protein
MPEKHLDERGINKKRIETLVDGVFAIAMTLLVLTLNVPALTGSFNNADLNQALILLSPKFFIYGLSFLLLAIFWNVHHRQFSFLKYADTKLLWINIVWLMFVVLVPFSTSIVGEYGNLVTANVFFDVNMLLIGILAYFNWRHITFGGLVQEKRLENFKSAHKVSLMLPIVSIIALIFAFIIPSYSNFVYFLMPLIEPLLKRK